MTLTKKKLMIMIFIFICLFNNLCLYGKIHTPSVNKGNIDLTEWNFKDNGNINLDGRWYYAENEFINPDDLDKMVKLGKFNTVPKLLQGNSGFETYGLILDIENEEEMLGILIPRILNAHKMWINGKLVSKHGLLNDENDKYEYIAAPSLIYIDDTSEKIEIVLQLSNYDSNKGGIVDSFIIGDFYKLNKEKENRTNLDAFLFGIIFIMALYHLILFFHYKKDIETLYFSLICITIAVRTLTSREYMILKIFNISEVILSEVTNINFSIGVLACLLFTYTLFKDKKFKIIVYVFSIISVIFIIFILVMNNKINLNIVYIYETIVLIVAFYATYKVAIAAVNHRDGAIIILSGIIIFLLIFFTDLIRSLGFIYIPSYTPIGFVILIIAQSTVIARKSIKSFYRVEHLNDKLMELDKIKDEFLANTSHELRTPLNGIVGLADSMINGDLDEMSNESKDKLKIIVKSAKRLFNLINDILDFEKLKNHDIVLNRKFVDLKQIVNMVISVSSILIRDKDVKVINDISEDFPKIYLDEDRIHQILQNIIANSMKFTKKGYIKISTLLVKDNLEINIEDTGIGIPDDKIKTIFNSFEQVDNSLAREYGGTGLGLSIVKKLVELHDGKIFVYSELGKGTKINIKIPVLKSKKIDKIKEDDISDLQDSTDIRAFDNLLDINDEELDNKKSRVLVVDDDEINLYVLINLLKLDDYSIHTAKDGIEALEKLKKYEYDLVLLDIMMPKLTGYEVCKVIREEYRLFELPVIMITSKNMQSDILEGFKVGTNDYISKPFNKVELLARVNTLVSLKKAIEKTILNIQYIENEKLESLEVMVDSITHNIKTPIMSSAGGIKIIKRDIDIIDKNIKGVKYDESIKDCLMEINDWQKRIQDNLIYMSNMITAVKFKAGEFENNEFFEIEELLNKSILLMKFELNKKKCYLEKEFKVESLVKLKGNINYLIQILNNLILNAIEASSEKSKIIIGSKLYQNAIIIFVKNFDCLIQEEVKENLFKKMTTTKGARGRGIGLYLSQSIIRAKFNGEIFFESSKAETTFYLKIPIYKVREDNE